MNYSIVTNDLKNNPRKWLITGVAGFIGSNLLETLLKLDQVVVGLDNLSTGYKNNLKEVQTLVTKSQWNNFSFIEGDIRDINTCITAVKGIDFVLHQAALGSVPRSIIDPIATNEANVTGFLNVLHASKAEKVKSFTYAASSSTYGDHKALPKVEEYIGDPLSPYAVTKYVNELYAKVYSRTYDFNAIGLRYFNVFGKRQDPNGAYAAVIPKWTAAMIKGEDVYINGDGKTSRDFCFVDNVVQINILAAVAPSEVRNQVYNVAVGDTTSLNELFLIIKDTLNENGIRVSSVPLKRDFRDGDVRHSQAKITKAKELLCYQPSHKITDGLKECMPWYVQRLRNS